MFRFGHFTAAKVWFFAYAGGMSILLYAELYCELCPFSGYSQETLAISCYLPRTFTLVNLCCPEVLPSRQCWR